MANGTQQENVREFEDGESIFREGEDTRHMFIVQTGSVVISKNTPNGKVELARLQRGDFLGEISLLESLPRNADAHAKGKARLYVIQPGGFLLKIRRDPTFAFELMQALSGRIRRTNEKLLKQLENKDFQATDLKKILDENGT
jgi:CRP/FNR family cyclic AMP-dependent transcriptional regulator